MTSFFLFLAVAIFGINLMFGIGKEANYYKFLIWLIFAPILLAIGWNHSLWFWYGLPFWAKVLSLLIVPFLISALLKALFPKAKWLNNLQAVLFQSLVYAVTFPIRFLWRSSQFILGRERNQNELNPYRPVVGNRPPIENPRERNGNNRNNIFD